MPIHQGLDWKVAAGTPRAGAVGVTQVIPRELGWAVIQRGRVSSEKKSTQDKHLRGGLVPFRLNGTQSIFGVEPAAAWGERKWDAPSVSCILRG